MTKAENLFISCVESRIQNQGSLYGRFYIGPFFRGQAVTFANALRRSLLSEIPGVIITDLVIDGADHEFVSLPGVEEPVFDILLNIKNTVFAPCISKLNELEKFQAEVLLYGRGPAKLTARDLKIPRTVKCVNPETHLATLTTGGELSLRFTLSVCTPQQSKRNQSQAILPKTRFSQEKREESAPLAKATDHSEVVHENRRLIIQTVPMPIQKVNYSIKSLNEKDGSEFVVFEVWTDGSLLPHEAVQYGLKQLTHLFYQFASLNQNKTISLVNPKVT